MLLFTFLICCFSLANAQIEISGELIQFHKITLTFQSEKVYVEEPSTFKDVRMEVSVIAPSGKTYNIPGYFAADGNASETSATSGNKWRIHFNPSEVGAYTFTASFKTGNNVAVSGGGVSEEFDGASGSFSVLASNNSGNDFRAKGKLQYVEAYAAQFANGDFYFEVGADSPETFLEYADFDATAENNTYAETANRFRTGDPTWQGGKGTEIIAAVNYLASQGMNVHYFLTNNITGDGKKAYPFPDTTSFLTYDVSKLSQWGIVFDHMYNQGIALEMVLLETENLNWFEDQEGVSRNGFADSRKIYYRELIARFGYLNVIWNVGEEANWANGGDVYTPQQIEEAASYIESTSPYDDLITVHNGPSSSFSLFPRLIDLPGNSSLSTISMQGNFNNEDHGNIEIANLRTLSAPERKWVVRYTEPFSSDSNPNVDTWTNNSLWAGICAGAVGAHYYAGGGQDITGDNYTNYEPYYERMRHAKDFFEENEIPFWEMSANNNAINTGFLLSKPEAYYIGFLKNGGSATIDLEGNGEYEVKWFNPRDGGSLLDGSIETVSAGNNVDIGTPPNETSQSWVVLIKIKGDDNDGGNTIPVDGVELLPNEATIRAGESIQLDFIISPTNATNKTVSWSSNNTAIVSVNETGTITGIGEGVATITISTNDGNFSANSLVNVVPAAPNILPQVTASEENSANEGEPITININLSTASIEAIRFDISYSDVTTSSDDYVANTETITFLPGELVKNLVLETISDEEDENDEVLQIEFIPESQNLVDNTEPLVALARILDDDGESNIRLFPNPVAPLAPITLTGIELGLYQIRIFTLSGNLIFTNTLEVDNGTFSFPMPANISQGIYILRLQGQGNSYDAKLTLF